MNNLINIIYPRLPLFCQNILISIFGFYWQKRRFGGIYTKEVKKFKEREEFSKREWEEYQEIELRKILINAFENVPFYRKKYSEAGLEMSDFINFKISDLKKLPFLEKNELREFGRTALMSELRDKRGAFYYSSGSTGTPVAIYLSKKTHQLWTAGYEVRVKNWAGVSKNMRRGMIGGRRILPSAKATPPFFRYNYFERMTYFSAYHISPGTVLNYVDGMNKHKIDFIMGYAVSNYALAKFINQNNIRAPKLKAVITSSEKLTEEMRVALKRAYGCETYDTWSGVEACAQISECEYHSLHESPDIGIIELVDEYGKYVENGQTGEAICTSLINFDQPLIRYRCGDLLTSGESSCTCGRNMKVYSNIVGRLEDIVIGKDGREMVRFHGLFLELDTVVQGQVIQYAEDDFEIKVVCSGKLTENESEKIKMRLFSQVGNVRLRVTQVEELEKGPNGKFKAVISKIKR